ncbi:MAG: response regulator [Nitrospinae bacterium]|nr:response regulator [Nitrospinota bacterium]MBF0634969.1 response regulator [Nitrospinota bacterium]
MTEKAVRMLLVEDDPSHRLLIRKNLENHGVTNDINEVEDGQEALDYIYGVGEYADRKKYPMPDIVILDIKMPRVDGFGVLERLKSDPKMKRIPVIMLTTSSRDEEIAKGYEYGANAYVTKPLDFADFAKKLHDLKMFWVLTAEIPHDAD